MTNIILDTNIIITYPKLLGLVIPDITFIVPFDVISELNTRASKRGKNLDSRVDLIEKGADQGTISIINTDLPGFKIYHDRIKSTRISDVDMSIIATALFFIDKAESAQIATSDREIVRLANELGIHTLSANEIDELLQRFKAPIDRAAEWREFAEAIFEALVGIVPFLYVFKIIARPLIKLRKIEISTIQRKIRFFEKKETANLIVGIVIGGALMFLAILIYNNLRIIIATINVWGTITLILLSGVMLFVLREKQRFIYGVVEFSVGVFSIILLMNNNNFNYDKIEFTVDFAIKLLAGLYIMVRGQDNIVKALKDTKLGVRLKKFGIGV